MPDRWVNPAGWGSQPGSGSPPPRPRRRSPSGPWWRRWYVVLAAAVLVLGVVALSDDNDDSSAASSRATAAPTSLDSLPTVASTLPTTTSPPTTIAKVEVPKLVGMKLARARDTLADRGLRGAVKYISTARYAGGTVVSQSRGTGADVAPDSRITLVVAKAPPPTTAPAPPPTKPSANCDRSYPDFCIPAAPPDLDCADVNGNDFTVRPPDPHGFDREGDGRGCEG